MVKIYIENYELDVMQDFSHQVTYAIDDIRNLDSKSTTFTKTIILPGTAHNNKLLGNIFELTNSNFTTDTAPNVGYNFNASKSAQARIEENGLQIMKGVMRLMEIVVDGSNIEYEVALFGELGGFINAMGSKRLTGNDIASDDLDFSEYNHTWDITNITNSWNTTNTYNALYANFNATTKRIDLGFLYLTNISAGNTFTITDTSLNDGTYTAISINYYYSQGAWHTVIEVQESITNENDVFTTITLNQQAGRGYVYPLIDYGGVTRTYYNAGKHDYNYTAFRPAFFVREILEKIIADAGYSFESNFFNTNFFNRLIIPNNDKALLNRTATDYIIGNVTQTYNAINNHQVIAPIILTNPTLNNFSFNGTNGIYTYNGLTATQTKLSLQLQGTYSISPFANARINVISTQGVIFTLAYISGTGTINTILTNTASFNTNDTLSLQIVFNGNPQVGFNSSFTDLAINFSVVQDPPVAIEYLYGQTLNMNYLLPKNIYQKDFFISIMKMFNLYVTEDKFIEKHLKIEPYVDFYDTGNYLDWTEKVDRSQPIRIKPMSEINSRYYEFKYKQFSDYWNDKYRSAYFEGYGDRIYDNEFEFTTDKQTNEVIFSATPLVEYEGEDKIVSAIYKMNNAVEEALEHNIRIMQFNLIEDISSWNILNETSVLWTGTSYPYAGHLDNPDLPESDLNFGALKELYFILVSGALSNNLFNLFYSPYMAEITDKDSRLITARMKFNELDIFNLDFKRLIFIDNVVYRLSKIIDYSLNELCNVELLRVINTTYYDVPLPVLELGMEYQGGIIAYLDETGQHGIIIPIFVDYINYANWSHNYNTFWGITSTDYGDGITNTAAIIANDTTGLSTCAAEFCSNLNSGGYTDWVLPTRDDLSNIWSAGQIPSALNYSYIWTSSEINSTEVISFGTFDGTSFNMVKYGVIPVLPIRYF